MPLSKSKLIAYRQCPKRLWLEIHRPEQRDDTRSQAAFQIGYAVGELAQQVFDPKDSGLLLDPFKIGWDKAYEDTTSALASGEEALFEATMQADGALALADVMLPTKDATGLQWQMLEVKSSASVKDYQRDDVAIQSYIAMRNGVSLSQVGIAHVNNQFVYQGDGNYEGFFTIADLTEEAFARHDEVKDWIAAAKSTAALPQEPAIETGPHCYQPFECGFCEYCHLGKDPEPQPEHSIHLLPNLRATKKAELEADDITELRDIPDHLLSEKQQRVKHCTLNQETYFDAAGAQQALAPITYPAHFLDFEAAQLSIPIWKGQRPYQAIPFQYSLHLIDASGTLAHREFLDLTGNDPRRPLAEQLLLDCGSHGDIYVYNATYERRVIHELGKEFPDLAEPLSALLPRIKDLLPIARDHYYHPSQCGKWGLKAMLPAVCPELAHSELEGVQDGMAAMQSYAEAIHPTTTPERKLAIAQELRSYCELDTLATVKIWQHFVGIEA